MEGMDRYAELRRRIVAHLEGLGFTITPKGLIPPQSKDALRAIQKVNVQRKIAQDAEFIRYAVGKYLRYFANGDSINPEAVRPRLYFVRNEAQAELFRLATYLWSVPLSNGMGRQFRWLIMDEHTRSLMGIAMLNSPMRAIRERDRALGLTKENRPRLINYFLEAAVLGAVPPWNELLGGKLAALSVVSTEVREYAERAYKQPLWAVFTMSALGRSSIYNRLRLGDRLAAEALGYTGGWGSTHLEGFYKELCQVLVENGRQIIPEYGASTGSVATIKNMERALRIIGLPRLLTRHGMRRQIFLFRLVSNLEALIAGTEASPKYIDMPFADIAAYWKQRWLLGRAERVDTWRSFRREAIAEALLGSEAFAYGGFWA